MDINITRFSRDFFRRVDKRSTWHGQASLHYFSSNNSNTHTQVILLRSAGHYASILQGKSNFWQMINIVFDFSGNKQHSEKDSSTYQPRWCQVKVQSTITQLLVKWGKDDFVLHQCLKNWSVDWFLTVDSVTAFINIDCMAMFANCIFWLVNGFSWP